MVDDKNITKNYEIFNSAQDPVYAKKKYDSFIQKLDKKFRTYKLDMKFLIVIITLAAIYLIIFASGQVSDISSQLNKLETERSEIINNPASIDNNENFKHYDLNKKDEYPVEITDGSSIQVDRNNIFVSDNADIIDKDTRSKIYDMNKALAQYTNGAQYMVVTIDSLPAGMSIEEYGLKLGRTLGVGNKELSNGVVYIVSLKDRKFRLEVGPGMEGVLNDGKAGRIINDDDVVENFKDENYSQAILDVSKTVTNLMNVNVSELNDKITDLENKRTMIIVLPVLVIIVAAALLEACHLRRSNIKQVSAEIDNMYDTYEKEPATSVPNTDFYYLLLSGVATIASFQALNKNIGYGKVLSKHPNGEIVSNGVLVGDTLFDSNGVLVTNDYSSSSYNPSNSSSGGDSFGGGSFGGGGASGGW